MTADTVEEASSSSPVDALAGQALDSVVSPQECQMDGCDNPQPTPDSLDADVSPQECQMDGCDNPQPTPLGA